MVSWLKEGEERGLERKDRKKGGEKLGAVKKKMGGQTGKNESRKILKKVSTSSFFLPLFFRAISALNY